MGKLRTWGLLAAALLTPSFLAGCGIWYPFYIPVPIQPWVAERMEEKYCYPNDHRTPIMPPIREGFPPPLCEDPPSEEEVLRTMLMVKRGIPYVCEEFRDEIEIVSELLVDRIDPPRFYPLIGPAQLHHCHWKSTIYYTETIQSDYPFPFRCKKRRVEVVYIDKDHLHLYVGSDPAAQQSAHRDLVGH